MKEEDKRLISMEIAPLVHNGDITLFLGAGISIDTPAINGLGIPSTPNLIKRICKVAGYEDNVAETADLPTAFGVGEDEIDNFENFLISNFTAKSVENWQLKIFQNWWRAIFTTNIDTIPELCINKNLTIGKDFPSYCVFNYDDREPIQSLPTEPPLVYLHGKVSSPSSGFIFDNVSYADHSVKQSDWLVKSALHISHGNCLFVGSKFKESDIETALRRRQSWDKDQSETKNWIVLRSFTELEKNAYKKRGITPIEADAKEFFEVLFSIVSPLSRHKFIKKKAPFLAENTDDKSLAWFTKNMSLVSEEIERSTKKNSPFSLFYNGDMPNWFYMRNQVPAEISSSRKIVEEIIKFENSDEKGKILAVLGPLASGKTTAAMLALSNISGTHNNIYQFSGLDGIDIEATWSVVKDLKGLVVIFIDSSSGYFYAVNEIIERVLDRPTSCKLCFLLEERTIQFDRNKRHFTKIPQSVFTKVKINNLDFNDAGCLLDKTEELGVSFEKLKGLERNSAIRKIVDYDQGYNGDLLATLYDLSYGKPYKEKLAEEFEEIDDGLARDIFETVSIVTASRLEIPINYLCEIYSISVESLINLIESKLKDKLHHRGMSMTLTSRHHSIAQFHLENNFDKKELTEKIISLMKCVSSKFGIDDIKLHPISYKIYSKVLSYHYLTEILFSGSENYSFVHEIYSECQKYFPNDGIFWLQYGRFLERDKKIEEALHCFRKGLALYDSFQLRHALGQLLLKKYRLDKSPDDSDYREGVKILQNEIDSRGATDAYPYTALGNELIKIYNKGRKKIEIAYSLKEIINRGLKLHRTDQYFSTMVSRYITSVGDTEVQ
ncbi:SIR2 family protein [Thalassolituus pacificus]|uniref:SIR2 family protein n=1 Tax=Thalassolituus pacificus TaxID=2975440 RepID=A0A9X2WF60_9GAMM|nr:SIR2 family protein [Thalassolituus pacificus]MCT7358945.1 SIR2 family protein [Thalassolituus pacificus]